MSMTNQTIQHDDAAELAEDLQIYPGIRSYVTTEAEFRAAVQAGIDSYAVGPNRDLETVAAEIRREILASP